MMRIEEEEVKPTWLPHHLNHLLMLQLLQQMLLAKEEGREKESLRVEEEERRGQYARRILQSATDKGCPKGYQCPHAHPRKAGKCLRCGATGHDLASCRRPAKDPKTKGSPPPPKGQGRGKGKAKAKPKRKAKAQVHESTAQPAGANAAWALEEDAECGDIYDELNYVTPASACSFDTAFLPTFHAASTQDNSMEDHPENLQFWTQEQHTASFLSLSWEQRSVRKPRGVTSKWQQAPP